MTTCTTCAAPLPPGESVCPGCGALLSQAETLASDAPTSPVGGEAGESGELVAGRYRLAEPIGRGGMGEVYRAHDVRLGHPVALKFLLSSGNGERFLQEIRLSRSITHRNVCRVHDLGDHEGRPFLTMELVEGEDLASLLRRVGRLPGEKAIEVACEMAAGIAAAHHAGVLHRDLKPGNVLFDRDGRVKVTDFGLAVAEGDAVEGEVAGTPRYMAPEQLAGSGVSALSDIYSFGLVFYELVTGRPAFDGESMTELAAQRRDGPRQPSELVADCDSQVERVIMRCLETDPGKRPQSILEALAELPGGDPLAVARAAGYTPSPRVLAAARTGGLSRRAAAFLAVGTVLLAALGLVLGEASRAVEIFDPPLPPTVLGTEAAELAARLGFDEEVVPWQVLGVEYDHELLDWVEANDLSGDRWRRLGRGVSSPVRVWFRRQVLAGAPSSPLGRWSRSDPPIPRDGPWIEIVLDPEGRLLELTALRRRWQRDGERLPLEELVEMAGLEASSLTPAEPRERWPVPVDHRTAWDGVVEGEVIRVEAASLESRPVAFAVIGPWQAADGPRPNRSFLRSESPLVLLTFLLIGVGLMLAARNYGQRADRRGALRTGATAAVLYAIAWLFGATHVADLTVEFEIFRSGVGRALYLGAMIWLYYVALEPFVRRYWPETLLSWSRLVEGRPWQPVVGRDLLVGCFASAFYGFLGGALWAVAERVSEAPPQPFAHSMAALLGPRYVVSNLALSVLNAMTMAFFFLFLLVGLRALTRHDRVATLLFFLIAWTAIASAIGVSLASFHPLVLTIGGVMAATWALLLSRFGLLAMLTAVLFPTLVSALPITGDLGAWYAGSTYMVLALLVAMIGVGYRLSTRATSS